MKVRDLLARMKEIDPDILVCVAEIDQAFAVNIAAVEAVDRASIQSRKGDGTEAVGLADGSEQVVVIRW
ncbi:sugar phosphorylase [Mesorhizobium sp. ORM6]